MADEPPDAPEPDNVVPFKKEAKAPASRRGKAVKKKRGEAAEIKPGAAASPEMNPEELATELRLWWENGGGDAFWLNNASGWAKWPLGAIEDYLTSKMVKKQKREGEFMSDQKRLLLHVREHRMVEEILAGLSGYPANIYNLVTGERIIVRHSPRLLNPVEGEWPTVHAMIHAKLDFSWGSEEGHGVDQTPYFHGWMKMAIEALYLGGPGNFRPGQGLIFAGPADSGKSRLQHQIITPLLGGRSADPGPYLFGRTDFNSEMFSSEHLMMEDPASSTKTVDRIFFGEQLKQLIVNDTQRLHAKREDAMVVSPFFRTTISINDDPDKMRVLPLLTPDMKDKLMLFLVSDHPLPMPTRSLPERKAFREKLNEELPAYAWWLLNKHEIDPKLQSEQGRFGITHWHHPTLATDLFDDTPAAELLQIIDAATFKASGAEMSTSYKLWELSSDAKEVGRHWQGSALELERLLLGDMSWICSLDREAKKLCMHHKCDRLLGRLKEDQPDRVKQARSNIKRGWSIIASE